MSKRVDIKHQSQYKKTIRDPRRRRNGWARLYTESPRPCCGQPDRRRRRANGRVVLLGSTKLMTKVLFSIFSNRRMMHPVHNEILKSENP
jgi:hypothetical protein